MNGDMETQGETQPEKVTIQHPIVTGFYAAMGGAIFAAAYTFIRAQFSDERRR
jgi:hypothetical protein